MTDHIELLTPEDVITLEDEKTKPRMPHKTFKVDELTLSLAQNLSFNEEQKEWLKNGISANVLVAGKLWRKGKVKLSIEFIPDENEHEKSPLDDFRK
jgi:KGK domain